MAVCKTYQCSKNSHYDQQYSHSVTSTDKIAGLEQGSQLTGMISAASCGTASPPGTVKLDGVPVAQVIITQSIRRQITNLQPGELPQKLTEWHPGDKGSHFAYWSAVASSSVSNCIANKAHQNSPSSICKCKSSFSDGSISSHSGELRREHTQSSYSMTWAELNKSFCVISYLSLQAPVHSTWPHGLRIRISLSVWPLNSTCQRAERSHTRRDTKLNSNVSVINKNWDRYLFESSHWVSVTLNQLLKRHRFHVKGTGDLNTIINNKLI